MSGDGKERGILTFHFVSKQVYFKYTFFHVFRRKKTNKTGIRIRRKAAVLKR